MRIIVMSDTHRDFYAIQELVKKHRSADIFIHLGDGEQELHQITELYPECKFLSVRGNCDFGVSSALAGCFNCGTAKIFYTHGHMYGVKYELDSLMRVTKEMGANVVLFGHTHIPLVDYRDGIHLMNPGSLGMPRGAKATYGVLDVTEQGIVCYINELDV
ncbi:metallophosphoesterase [Oscillospiraceae bacterium PP1C4]